MALVYNTPRDSDIPRNRAFRAIVFLGAAFGFPFLGLVTGWWLSGLFFDFPASQPIGAVLGAAAGFVGFLALKPRLVVVNNTTGGLVTTDALQSLLGRSDVHVIYGPGTHFALPWEQRYAENNIPVLEAAETFSFTVLCKDGALVVSGSFRLRPNFRRPLEFISGVASIASDLRDLIVAEAVASYAGSSVMEATARLPQLNERLRTVFVGDGNETPFEERFGVQVGDVTLSSVVPASKELQRTVDGLAEASLAFEGTARLLGMTAEQMRSEIASGKLTGVELERAREEFRIISGNMDGNTIKRWVVDVRGVDPELAKALASIAGNVPPETIGKVLAGSAKVNAQKGGAKK